MTGSVLNWLLLALCLGASFLLSGMEAGVFALNRLRVRRLARAGRPSAKILNQFMEKPEKFLWTILVGNTLANFLILGWMLAKLHEWFIHKPVLIAVLFAATVFFFYAFFDLLPKMLFRTHPNFLSLLVARVFRLINFLLSPIVLIVEDLSLTILKWSRGQALTGRLFGNREEMRAMMRESGHMLTDDEHTMVNRILDLQKLTVGQIARPLVQTAAVESSTPLREVIALSRDRDFSRFPIWEIRGGQRRIAGLIDVGPLLFRDNLDVEKPVSAYMIPAIFVHEGVRLEVALRLIQRGGQRTAIVLSRTRAEVGIVAVKDIIQVMFGEMKL